MMGNKAQKNKSAEQTASPKWSMTVTLTEITMNYEFEMKMNSK